MKSASEFRFFSAFAHRRGFFALVALSLVLSCAKGGERPADATMADGSPAAESPAGRIPAGAEAESKAPHPRSVEALSKRAYGSGVAPALEKTMGPNSGLFTYSSEGNTVHFLSIAPTGGKPEAGWPVLVIAHGYVAPSTWKTGSSYAAVAAAYAKKGFLVLVPDYRGHGLSSGDARTAFRTQDFSIDVMNLIADLRLVPDADASRVFLLGHSMGGEIALRVAECGIPIKAVSLWAAVSAPFPENTLYYLRKGDKELAATLEAAVALDPGPDEFWQLSVTSHYDRIRVPVIIHHAPSDDTVPYEWSVTLLAALEGAGIDARLHTYPGDDHNLSKNRAAVVERDAVFFLSLR